jgi:hypothetical protein
MFTEGDQACMSGFGLDLWNYDDVKTNAPEIYRRVESGNMPQGGPRWSEAQVAKFKSWMDEGYPA